MKVLYIGQYSEGTTSRMRGEAIKGILNPTVFDIIDTHIPFYNVAKISRTLAFRFKKGPLIAAVNRYIKDHLKRTTYDLIWVDKGVFIKNKTTLLVRDLTSCLVHSTPDMAFYANQSKHFNTSLPLYDYVITTKSAEIAFYKKFVSDSKILLISQGFDQKMHIKHHDFDQKDDAIVFIGLAEKSRFTIAETLIKNGFKLKLVGHGWSEFVAKFKTNENLLFLGTTIYGLEYSELLSSSKFALGLLSKNFPERHTTRTFEIPACGTALLTERNQETVKFYNEDEVIFYSSEKELIEKIKHYLNNDQELEELTDKGYDKAKTMGYDYHSILARVLKQILD